MSPRFQKHVARYAAMPRRERLLLPAALCFAVLMLGYLALIEPARKQTHALQQQLEQNEQENIRTQAQLTVLRAKLQNPDSELRQQLDAVRGQTRTVDDRFKTLQGALVPAQEMSTWLSGLLRTQRGLQVVGLRTLPVASVGELSRAKDHAAPPTGAASAPDTAPQDAWLYRHGVEVTVRGNYHDLLAYLDTLEHMPRRVYWGELKLDARESPDVVMTLTVYTLSVEKTWLAI